MKNIIIALCFLINSTPTIAQFNTINCPNKNLQDHTFFGFNKQSLFVGNAINVGFVLNKLSAGLMPEIGFTVKKWLDVGALLNFNYYAIHAVSDPRNYYYNGNIRKRSFNYGVGAFARAYPLRFLFIEVQPQFNFSITTNEYHGNPNVRQISNKTAPSLFLAGGYWQRFAGENKFYIGIMFDVLNDKNSPYRDPFKKSPQPMYKVGFDIYLHPHR